MDPNLPGGPVELLRWLHAPVPQDAVERVLQTDSSSGAPPPLHAALAAGGIVEDPRGWIRVNPLVRVEPEPALRDRARRVVECALEAHPSDLALRVELLGLQDWSDPTVASDATALLHRARLSGRGDELIGLIEAAGLLHTLLGAVREPLLRLLIEEGYTAEARPFLRPEEVLLQAAFSLAEGNTARALAIVPRTVSPARPDCFALRMLRARAHMLDYRPVEALLALDGLEAAIRSPEEAIELALVRHRVANHTADADACARARAELEAAVEKAEDGWLRSLLFEALAQETLRVGDVPQAAAWLVQLQGLVAEGWAPGLAETVHVHAGRLACHRGDHRALDEALAAPVVTPRHQTARTVQRAAALVFRGAPALALELRGVQRFGGFVAQLLAEVGRFHDALLQLDQSALGYAPATSAALRAPVLLMLGDAHLLPLPAGDFPLLVCQVHLHNTRVHLALGDLDAAAAAVEAGLAAASAHELGELHAHLSFAAADLAARRGRPGAALALLDGLLLRDRHPYDFLRNRVRAARCRLEDRIADDVFVERLIRQEDVLTLGMLADARTLPPAAQPLLERLPEATRRILGQMFVEVAETEKLVVDAGCRWVVLPSGDELDLRRSGPPRRVLRALVEARMLRPEQPLDVDALIAAGWPGERIIWAAARTRLYTVVRRLRAMGLDGIETVPGGYRLTPRWAVQEIGSRLEE